MKITDYISVKSAYEALEAVRGCMPSTETAKSWVVESITSAWNKPAGKAVFIAAGFMATLAVAFTAVKAFSWFSSRFSEARPLNGQRHKSIKAPRNIPRDKVTKNIARCLKVDLKQMTQYSNDYKRTYTQYEIKTLKECLERFENLETALSTVRKSCQKKKMRMMRALQDLIREKKCAS
ncbi:MAG: hypothetical protein H7A40_05830 [Chlamydiales bacterium]|nr:hypothetical protein [Chlamydiales bacterium]